MSCYWKRKPTWRKDLITYNSHHWIMFSFNWLVIIWRGTFIWNWRPSSKRSKNFGRRWERFFFLRRLISPPSSENAIEQFSLMSYVYHPLSLIIKLRFTWGERKTSSTIKKCQNIMNMIVGLLITKISLNEEYNATISNHDITDKILSFVSSCLADVVIWPK